MTPGRKYTIYTGVFYLFLMALTPFFMRHLTAGPCNPGFGFFMLVLTLLIAIFGLISFGVALLRGNQLFKGPLMVSGLALTCLLALVFASRS
jgi:hypothetical protein